MDNTLSNRYAFALLEVAKENNRVEDYRKDIITIYESLKENENFAKLLAATNIDKEERYKIIESVFKDFDTEIVNYVKIIVKNNRAYYLTKILKETIYRFDDYLNIEEGKLISAMEMSDDQVEKIVEALESTLNKRVSLKRIVDPSLIGGFKVMLKNDIYDATVLRKVHNIKKKLLNKEDVA